MSPEIKLTCPESKEFYAEHRREIIRGVGLFFEMIGIEIGNVLAAMIPTRFGDSTIVGRTVDKLKDAGDDLIESIEDSFNV